MNTLKVNTPWFLSLLTLLTILPVRAQTIANFSALVTLPPGGSATVGFVVPGVVSTALLVRAVGPSLQSFGISNPVAAPDMQVFNAKGTGLYFTFLTAPVTVQPINGGTPIVVFPGPNWNAIFGSVGAFPLPGGEQAGIAYNYGSFPPGVYTVKLVDDSGKGGTVLFEVYLLSGTIAAGAGPVIPPQ
jgi:hypothetical protein